MENNERVEQGYENLKVAISNMARERVEALALTYLLESASKALPIFKDIHDHHQGLIASGTAISGDETLVSLGDICAALSAAGQN